MSAEKYPRSSVEDDFNYGTNVATASVQIRMGEWLGRLIYVSISISLHCYDIQTNVLWLV